MSYLRWLCAMHFAKLTRHGNALVETVNAFRLHRQQKTLACEAAAKARAELWSRLTENLRRLRAEQPSFLRNSIQSRRLDHEHQNNVNEHETAAETVRHSGSFRSTAKTVDKYTFRGEQSHPTSTEASSLSTVLGSHLSKTGESLCKLLQKQKQSRGDVLPQSQLQRQLSAKSDNSKSIATPRKSLALLAMSRNCSWAEGDSPVKLQESAPQADHKTAAKANKPTDEPAVLVRPTALSQPKYKTSKYLPTVQMSNLSSCQSSQNHKAMLLPERPNILVLPEVTDTRGIMQKHAASSYDAQQRTGGQCCEPDLKLLSAPHNTLKSTADCQLSTEYKDCLLPPQSEDPMTILVTNVLDKYKIISLPAGRAIPGRPKRHVQIETKKRGSVRANNQPDLKRKKF